MNAVMVFSASAYDNFLKEHEGKYIACMFNHTEFNLSSGVYIIASDNLEDIFFKVNENIHNLDYYFITNKDGYTIRDNTSTIKD